MIFHELFDLCHKPVSDRRHECRTGDLLASVPTEEAGYSALALSRRDVSVEVHAVDALDFQAYMLFQDSGYTVG
jgi:hypothetical protein